MTDVIAKKKFISVVTPCYNEEENAREVYEQVRTVFSGIPDYLYEHIFIDNASTDKTVSILRSIADQDKNVKIILNARNFGHIRSPYYGLMQASGDAIILLVADLQDPPHMIKEFLEKWEEGYSIAIGIKPESQESPLMFSIRKLYYHLIGKISEVKLIKNFTAFGLYDRKIIDIFRQLDDPYPYLRGLVSEVGFDVAKIPYNQPARRRGVTKNNFYTLYDIAMLGITSHSKVPLRIATIGGFALSLISLLISIIYLLLKIAYWNDFSFGTAPILVGLFFFSSVQLFFIGLLGEYFAAIHTQVMKRPLVIEKERINF